ncbi:MAG: hydrogenase maturation protease [Sedimentisphaerales bacterium]
MTIRNKKILLIGFGNPARADDGLGPALAEIIESKNIPAVTVEADYQLAIEDSSQIAENDIVIFADASTDAAQPFSFQPVEAKYSENFSTHSIKPAHIMALAENLFGSKTKGYILGIRGYEFDRFGEGLTDKAKANLQKAADFLVELLKTKEFDKISKISACL